MDPLDIANVLTPQDTTRNVVSATVNNVHSDGTIDVDLGGNRILQNVAVLSIYTPSIGDAVEIVRRDLGSWLCLGTVLTSAATTVSVAGSWSLPYNVKPAPAPPPTDPDPPQPPPPPPPSPTTHKLVVRANGNHSWRNRQDGWDHLTLYTRQTDYPYQGAYTNYIGSQDGYWKGLYFYGTKFDGIRGVTPIKGYIHLARRSEGGTSAGVGMHIAPHSHKSMPSGAPNFTAAASEIGSLRWGASGTFELPLSFLKQLCNGTAHGFGHNFNGSSDYAIMQRVEDNADAGSITLYYQN